MLNIKICLFNYHPNKLLIGNNTQSVLSLLKDEALSLIV